MLTRPWAGRPPFKEERRREAGLDADGCPFPLTTAAARRNPGLSTGDQQPGAEAPCSAGGVSRGGFCSSYHPGRAPLKATHPGEPPTQDALEPNRLVLCRSLSGLEAAADACAWIESEAAESNPLI